MMPGFPLLRARLFQTQWNGIELAEVAAIIGVSITELAQHRFYEVFYRELSARGFPLDEKWQAVKRRSTARVRAVLEAVDPRWRDNRRTALAVGAGLGIVELPLVADGFRIDLQECQPESLKYYDARRPTHDGQIIISPDLSSIPTAGYDVIYFNQVAYALDDAAYRAALIDAARALKPGGVVAVWEPECLIRRAIFPATRLADGEVFWGWARSSWLHAAIARNAGLRLSKITSLSASLLPVAAPHLLGCVLPRSHASEQEMIFVKDGGPSGAISM